MLHIIKSGLLDSIQDGGRDQHAAEGINTNGPMDWYAMQVANTLVENDFLEGVIEMHFPAATIHFDEAVLIALSGADFGAVIGDVAIPINKPVVVPAHSELHFTKKIQGSAVYLAVHGGFAITPWLNSVATNMMAGVGGLSGEKLQKGDAIPLKTKNKIESATLKICPWRADTTSAYMDAHYLYFIKGPEWDWLTPHSQHLLLQEPFSIAPQSDRMAIRLQGEHLICTHAEAMVSAAVSMGTLQLLPSGQLLVLMADHQTTGGYPRIGTIITAHLPKLAQAVAGNYIHLLQVEQPTAEGLLINLKDELSILKTASEAKLCCIGI